MAYEQRDLTGAIFKAKEQPSEKHPSHTGSCLIDGKKYSISAWVNEAKSGEKYFSLKFSEPMGRSDGPTPDRQPAPDSDIPF